MEGSSNTKDKFTLLSNKLAAECPRKNIEIDMQKMLTFLGFMINNHKIQDIVLTLMSIIDQCEKIHSAFIFEYYDLSWAHTLIL